MGLITSPCTTETPGTTAEDFASSREWFIKVSQSPWDDVSSIPNSQCFHYDPCSIIFSTRHHLARIHTTCTSLLLACCICWWCRLTIYIQVFWYFCSEFGIARSYIASLAGFRIPHRFSGTRRGDWASTRRTRRSSSEHPRDCMVLAGPQIHWKALKYTINNPEKIGANPHT